MPRAQKAPEFMPQDSLRTTLTAFALAALYGIFAAPGFAAGRELLEILMRRAASRWIVNAANAGGYANLSTILSLGVMGLAWLTTFMVVWNRAEHAAGPRAGLLLTGKWIVAALAFAFLACLGIYALTGSPPRLTGG